MPFMDISLLSSKKLGAKGTRRRPNAATVVPPSPVLTLWFGAFMVLCREAFVVAVLLCFLAPPLSVTRSVATLIERGPDSIVPVWIS